MAYHLVGRGVDVRALSTDYQRQYDDWESELIETANSISTGSIVSGRHSIADADLYIDDAADYGLDCLNNAISDPNTIRPRLEHILEVDERDADIDDIIKNRILITAAAMIRFVCHTESNDIIPMVEKKKRQIEASINQVFQEPIKMTASERDDLVRQLKDALFVDRKTQCMRYRVSSESHQLVQKVTKLDSLIRDTVETFCETLESDAARIRRLLDHVQSEPSNIRKLEYLQAVLNLDPTHTAAYYQMALVCQADEKNQDALDYLTIGLESDPGHSESLQLAQELYSLQKNWPEVITVCQQWLQNHTATADGHTQMETALANARKKMEKYSQCIRDERYENAVQAYPNGRAGHRGLAERHDAANRQADALQHYMIAVAIEPEPDLQVRIDALVSAGVVPNDIHDRASAVSSIEGNRRVHTDSGSEEDRLVHRMRMLESWGDAVKLDTLATAVGETIKAKLDNLINIIASEDMSENPLDRATGIVQRVREALERTNENPGEATATAGASVAFISWATAHTVLAGAVGAGATLLAVLYKLRSMGQTAEAGLLSDRLDAGGVDLFSRKMAVNLVYLYRDQLVHVQDKHKTAEQLASLALAVLWETEVHQTETAYQYAGRLAGVIHSKYPELPEYTITARLTQDIPTIERGLHSIQHTIQETARTMRGGLDL